MKEALILIEVLINRDTNSKIQKQVTRPKYKVRKRALLSKQIHSDWRQKYKYQNTRTIDQNKIQSALANIAKQANTLRLETEMAGSSQCSLLPDVGPFL